ncbi:hypothetical protein BS47DRAFT_1386207 [Hydnum rufescens UP504]|uniref:Uncharacterized protein n=1 Tax=Hydnum rufescens UP504 TaxID=1448309 RepID=A0A9P6AF84_9AGAM|nr:hypothetical protein BS47DRAFT_1386207 [Hydnum rufescens UP504]
MALGTRRTSADFLTPRVDSHEDISVIHQSPSMAHLVGCTRLRTITRGCKGGPKASLGNVTSRDGVPARIHWIGLQPAKEPDQRVYRGRLDLGECSTWDEARAKGFGIERSVGLLTDRISADWIRRSSDGLGSGSPIGQASIRGCLESLDLRYSMETLMRLIPGRGKLLSMSQLNIIIILCGEAQLKGSSDISKKSLSPSCLVVHGYGLYIEIRGFHPQIDGFQSADSDPPLGRPQSERMPSDPYPIRSVRSTSAVGGVGIFSGPCSGNIWKEAHIPVTSKGRTSLDLLFHLDIKKYDRMKAKAHIFLYSPQPIIGLPSNLLSLFRNFGRFREGARRAKSLWVFIGYCRNLSVFLLEFGRCEAALKIDQMISSPTLPALSATSPSISRDLDGHKEALEKNEEAVNINISRRLSELDANEEALAAIEEALSIYPRLWRIDPVWDGMRKRCEPKRKWMVLAYSPVLRGPPKSGCWRDHLPQEEIGRFRRLILISRSFASSLLGAEGLVARANEN